MRIWGCPVYVLDKEADKLEPRAELRLFVGYPRGTKGGLFYSPKDKRIVISTHSTFLEDDYMNDRKPRSEITLDEMRGPTPIPIVQEDVPSDTQTQPELRRSGRVVQQPERFMFVGESSDLVPGEDESDPWTYNEALQDKDANEAKKMASQMGIEATFREKRIIRRKKQFHESRIDKTRSSIEIRFAQFKKYEETFCSIWRGCRIWMMKACKNLQVTVASAERNFSKLKLIKTFLRSTMSQDRLNGLAMLSIEKELAEQIDYTDVINVFAAKIVRRVVFK
ncbi:hypothetical protein ACS0TY_025989 [Phlomoides rotata]